MTEDSRCVDALEKLCDENSELRRLVAGVLRHHATFLGCGTDLADSELAELDWLYHAFDVLEPCPKCGAGVIPSIHTADTCEQIRDLALMHGTHKYKRRDEP